jgi:NADH dehydrogenase [ubiquinone] 1 alpha subcomplex assembly factor 7
VSLPNYRLDLAHRLEDTKGGDIVEICTAAKNIINYVGNQITSKGGCALIFDYGDWRIQNHKHVNPLDEPGAADLTAHVDFEALAQSSTPAAHTRITPQGTYLERLGITARANQLAGRLSGAALVSHIAAHQRLTHSEEMGTIFKVLGIFPPNSKIPPGLTK